MSLGMRPSQYALSKQIVHTKKTSTRQDISAGYVVLPGHAQDTVDASQMECVAPFLLPGICSSCVAAIQQWVGNTHCNKCPDKSAVQIPAIVLLTKNRNMYGNDNDNRYFFYWKTTRHLYGQDGHNPIQITGKPVNCTGNYDDPRKRLRGKTVHLRSIR